MRSISLKWIGELEQCNTWRSWCERVPRNRDPAYRRECDRVHHVAREANHRGHDLLAQSSSAREDARHECALQNGREDQAPYELRDCGHRGCDWNDQ